MIPLPSHVHCPWRPQARPPQRDAKLWPRCLAAAAVVRGARGVEALDHWLRDAHVVMAVTNKGLEEPLARELRVFHGLESKVFGNRLYFPWRGEGRCPVVCGGLTSA